MGHTDWWRSVRTGEWTGRTHCWRWRGHTRRRCRRAGWCGGCKCTLLVDSDGHICCCRSRSPTNPDFHGRACGVRHDSISRICTSLSESSAVANAAALGHGCTGDLQHVGASTSDSGRKLLSWSVCPGPTSFADECGGRESIVHRRLAHDHLCTARPHSAASPRQRPRGARRTWPWTSGRSQVR